MIRTIVIPDNTSFQLSVPENYIGRKIEIMYYPLDEIKNQENSEHPKTLAAFKGILTSDEVETLQESIKKSREEWERNF